MAAAGLALAACANTVTAPRLALQAFLTDVHAHAVVYAYTLLTTPAASHTPFIPFFDWVNASRADFRIDGCRKVNDNAVTCTVTVTAPGAHPRRVDVQMLEEGNAGDWLVGDPFTNKGAAAIPLFK